VHGRVTSKHGVATLALGLRPRLRGCKVAGQEEEARESHHKLLGVLESVREYEGVNPHTPKATPTWEMESRWTPKTSEIDCRGQTSMFCGVIYIIGKLLKHKCLKWARIAHLDI